MYLKATLAAAIILAGTAFVRTSSAADLLDGVYVTGCLPEVTCSAEAHPTEDGGWSFEWTATDRLGERTYCSLSAKLAPGRSVTTDGMELENVPTGILEGTDTRVTMLDLGQGSVHVGTDGDPCPKVPGVEGWIVVNGVYHLEGDV